MAKPKELLIQRGETFVLDVRWEVEPMVYKAITGVEQLAPLRLRVPGHDLPSGGWWVAMTNIKGMTELNAEANAIKDSDWHFATEVDANIIEINAINAAGFKPYLSGGILQYWTPQDLANTVARIDVRDKIGGTLLASSEVADTPLDIIEATVDAANKVTTLTISATDTAAVAWSKGIAELEMLNSISGTVKKLKLCSGKQEDPDPVRVAGEVTT